MLGLGPPEVEMIGRHVESAVRDALGTFRVVQIVGARQVGKTTLARQVGGDERRFVSLDEPAERDRAQRDPSGFLDSFGDSPLLIDEVQRVPDLYLAIKRIVDEQPERGRFLLTGSAEPTSSRQALDTLVGRIGTVELRPFSRGELLGHRERFLERIAEGQLAASDHESSPSRGLSAQLDSMLQGGFPEATELAAPARENWLTAYERGIFARDVRQLAAVEDLDRLGTLFRLIASHSGQLLKPSSLARDANLAANTARSWTTLLAETRTVDILPAWSGGHRARLVATPKAYVLDSGLLAASLGWSGERILRDAVQAGCLFETFVVQELLRQRTWMASAALRFLHFRDRDQHEVDLVIERRDGSIIGVEVKAASTVRSDDSRGLRALARRAGARFVGGIIVYCGEHPLDLGDSITAIPVDNLWR
jgi:predicted AAA+ superfamily ATPase